MPLSDYEKRVLDEIEQRILTEDPDLVSSMRSGPPSLRSHALMATAAYLMVGFGLLLVGLQFSGPWMLALGVLGFGALLAGADCAFRLVSHIWRLRVSDCRRAGSARRGLT